MYLIDALVYCYENITPFQAAILLSAIFLHVLNSLLRDMDVPPGPKGLPLFGYWPFLKSDTCHIQLQELGKKYGDVFSLRITGRLYIHLGSLKSVREAHITKSEYFGGRFADSSILHFMFNDGVAFINGEPWKVLRKFFLAQFKECGMNAVKENAVASVNDTLKETVQDLRNSKGQAMDMSELVTEKCLIVLRRIMFNDQGISIAELQKLNVLYGEMTKGMTSTNLLLIGPFAKYCIYPLLPSCWTLKSCNKQIEDMLAEVVRRQKSEYNESQIVNLIDSYFKERDERRKRGDPTAAYFTERSLVSSLSQFVTDGILTISVFIATALTTLIEYPDEQEKIYEEIMEVIGPDRLPTIDDKNKMPYTNAVIYEIIRYTDFFPLFPSLECTKETTVSGYKIPEGSITLINIYACNRNPEDFENPDEFNPSRYLSTPSKPRADLPMLFGIGKRACIGEAFSMIQTFLFLTTIVQNFRLAFPKKSQGSTAFSAKERLKVCAYPRSQKSH